MEVFASVSTLFEILYNALSLGIIGPFRVCHVVLAILVIFLWLRASRNSYTVSHILLKDERKCKRVKKALLESAKQVEKQQDLADLFAMTAEKLSECPSAKNMGMLGTFGPGTMVDAFDKFCWECEIGKIEGPVKTEYGYHLVYLHDRKTDEDYKNKIK
eukprot:g14248.t1